MAEFLVALVQSACLCGYLCGAYFVITHLAGGGSPPGSARRPSARAAKEDEESAIWRSYLAYDW